MKHQEILDDDQTNNGKKVIDKRTKKPYQRALLYFAVMLLASIAMVFYEFRNTLFPTDFFFYSTMVISVVFICVSISFILESFWFLVRKFKKNKSDKITLVDPFWFQIIEGAFAIWILFSALKIIQWIIF